MDDFIIYVSISLTTLDQAEHHEHVRAFLHPCYGVSMLSYGPGGNRTNHK